MRDAPGKTYEIEHGPYRPHALVDGFRLEVVAGPDAGVSYASSHRRSTIGTHESADLVLHDRTVSRFHCEVSVEQEPAGAFIRDLGSRNGTLVDGVAVLHAPLRPGTVLTLGTSQIRFSIRSEQIEIPLATGERFGLMVGRSIPMRAVFHVLGRAAESEVTVLLEGETGTGKEAAAESIHRESARKEGPFVVVDCGAISPDLLESELFGHLRGAFTGAVAGREGAFRAASGGTIFLDEVGELSIDLQPKLLRALERREVKRIGEDSYTPVDVRVVAATNRNLHAEVNTRHFRPDLYYRLAVLRVRLPSLGERPEDLPLLVDHLLESLGAAGRPEAAQLGSPDFVAELARHRWPGNIRELRNYLERCLALRERAPLGEQAQKAAPDVAVDVGRPMRQAREELVRAFDRRYLEEILRRNDDNVAAAARAAGVDRAFFYRLLSRYGLR